MVQIYKILPKGKLPLGNIFKKMNRGDGVFDSHISPHIAGEGWVGSE